LKISLLHVERKARLVTGEQVFKRGVGVPACEVSRKINISKKKKCSPEHTEDKSKLGLQGHAPLPSTQGG
jgi:hypothetical protein